MKILLDKFFPIMSKPTSDKNVAVPDAVLKDLLTTSEIRMLKNRWQIIQLLSLGKTVRMIAEEVGVGTDTVVRVTKMLEIRGLKGKFKKAQNHKSTPWIFGKKI